MKIQILGAGCAKCHQLYDNAVEAVKNLGLEFPVEKVENMKDIMSFGVPFTPAIVINGEVKAYGKVPSTQEIITFLTSSM